MLTQLQLEGPELEPLLVRVRSELGSAARIVQAEKVRSGGVAGFFARERYELTVEVDDEPHPAAPGLTVHVGAPSAAQHPPVPHDIPLHPAAASSGDTHPAPAAPPDGTFAAVTGLGGPVDRPTDAFAAIPGLTPGERRGAHDAVLAALSGTAHAATAGSRAAAPAATTPGTAGDTTAGEQEAFAAHPAFPALARHAPAAAPAGTAPDGLAPAAAPRSLAELVDQVSDEERAAGVSTESPSFASLLSQLGSSMGADPSAVAPAADAPAVVVPRQRTAPAGVAARYVTGAEPIGQPHALEPVVPEQRATVVPRPSVALEPPLDGDPVARPGRAVDPRAVAPSVDDATCRELAELGLPPHLRPQSSGGQLHTALRAALTRLPSAPPATNRAGGVLAVVGPLALALRVAREVAEELGLPATTSVAVATAGGAVPDVAARQVLHAPAEAADRRAAWRRRGNLTVVAVEAPLTSTGAADARDFLTALAPSATWGVVEATRKAQDIGAWTRALGGVHALALTDVEETADPAAVLALGIPVSRLGTRPATPRAWATLLTGRLGA